MHPFMPYVVGLPAAGAAYGAGLLSMGNGMAKTANTSYAQQQANAQQAAAAQSQREMEAAAANQRRAAVPARQQIGFEAPEADPAFRGSSQAESQDAWGQRGPDQHLYAQPKHQWLEQQPQVDWQNDAAAAQLAAAAAAAGQPIMAEWELAFMEQQLRQPNSGIALQGHQSTDPYSQHSGSSISSAAAVQQSRPQSRAALYGDFRRAQRYGKVDAATMHAAAVQSRRYQLQQQQLLQQQLQAQQAAAEARLHAPAGSAASSSSSSSTQERGLPPRSSSFTRSGGHHAPRPPKGAPPAANQQSTLSSIRQQQLQPPEPVVVDGASRLAHTLAHQRAAKAHAAAQASAAAAAGAAAAAAAQWQARQPQQPPPSQQQQQQQGGFVGASAPNVLYGDTRRFYLCRAKQHIQQHGQDQPQVFLQALTAAQRTELPSMPQQQQQLWLNNGSDSAHSTATSAWAYSSYKAAAAQLPRPPATPADLPSALQTPAVPSVLLCTENMTDEGASEDNEADAFCYIGGQGASAKGSSSKGKAQLDVYNMEMLRIAEVSLCVDALSPVALVKANTLLSASQLPGDITYMPVSMDSFLYQMGAQWKFSAFAIALGSSYFQRLLEAVPQLKMALRKSGAFGNYAQWMDTHPPPVASAAAGTPEQQQQQQEQQQGCHAQQAADSALRSIQFTCIVLATKAVDQIHALGLLRFMLCALSNGRVMMSPAAVAEVEMRCLKGLQWRLGPYFADDVINDELCEEQ